MSGRILVVGDVTIDVAWTVNEFPSRTAQQHGDAPVRARATPERVSERLGGAGTTALALWGLGHDVQLLGRWALKDEGRLVAGFRAANVSEVEPLTFRDNEEVTFQLIGLPAQVTTVKFRIYIIRGGGTPRLEYRFDQDPRKGDELGDYEASILPGDPVDAIVVVDAAKGTVMPRLLEALTRIFPAKPWFVDTKNPQILDTLLRAGADLTALVLNREELISALRHFEAPDELVRGIPTGPATRLPRHGIELHKALADALQFLADHLSGCRYLVSKLDVDGAIALCESTLWRAKPERPSVSAGVSAGDAFLASFVADHLRELDISQRLKRAPMAAQSWLEFSENFWKNWDQTAVTIEKEQPDIEQWARAERKNRDKESLDRRSPGESPEVVVGSIGSPEELEKRYQSTFDLGTILSGNELPLALGSRVVGSYISTEPNTRRLLRQIAGQMLEYFALSSPQRPLSFLLRGKPGSGKSFLAKQLAAEAGARIIPTVNASQMATTTELLNAIADAATLYADEPRPVLFIDEADATVGGGGLFALLLSVLWEGQVRVFPRTYQLPRRLVVLCAVSKREEDLAHYEKYEDFRSRLAGREYTLPPPNSLDRALLVGAALQRHHPGIVEAERGLFEMVAASAEASLRDIESLIASMHSPRDGRLRREDVDADRMPKLFALDNWLASDHLVRVVADDRTID